MADTDVSARRGAREPTVSVVVPVYGCAGTIEPLFERVRAVMEADGATFELILVDDGSRDGAWAVMAGLAARDERVVACRLSRNFGQHAALTAAIAQSRGRYVVAMDCDLQDPPEEIPRLIRAAEEGADVVLLRRRSPYQPAWRRAGASAYGRLYRLLTGLPRDSSLGTFSLITRDVADAFLQVGDRDRQYIPLLTWLGFRRVVLEYDRRERVVGRSGYTLPRLVAHALNGIVFSTTRFLGWTIYGGLLLALAGLGLAAFYVVRFFTGDVPPGFTSIIVVQLLIGGGIMVAVGVSALYVGKTFEQVRGRPLYIIAERVGPGDHAGGGSPNSAT